MNNSLIVRLATKEDLIDIVSMLADYNLGAIREKPSETLSKNYLNAFEIINPDPN